MTTIKAVLFDHDGTLVDSEHSHYEMWVSILKSHGIVLSVEEYMMHCAGIPTPANAVAIVDRYSLAISPSDLIEAKSLATESFLSKQAFPLTSGARESIGLFRQQGIKLAVVTGASREGVDATILSNGFRDIFQVVVSGDDVAKSKPSPDCYLLATQRLGLNASECMAIEDSENGVTSAVSANVPCVAISTPMSRHHDLSKAIRTFGNLNEASLWIARNYIFPS